MAGVEDSTNNTGTRHEEEKKPLDGGAGGAHINLKVKGQVLLAVGDPCGSVVLAYLKFSFFSLVQCAIALSLSLSLSLSLLLFRGSVL
jgi:hypothetical protein